MMEERVKDIEDAMKIVKDLMSDLKWEEAGVAAKKLDDLVRSIDSDRFSKMDFKSKTKLLNVLKDMDESKERAKLWEKDARETFLNW